MTSFLITDSTIGFTLALIIIMLIFKHSHDEYEASWDSLDSRHLPKWYEDSKFGIIIHWGVFSVPSFGSECFWENWQRKRLPEYLMFMKLNYPENFTYKDFGPQFTGEFYNPDDWAELINSSGARYVVLTSKHREGFTLWPSKSSWNSKLVGPHKDLVGDLAESIRRKTNLHFGLYYSLSEWFHNLYLKDKRVNFQTQMFVERKIIPDLYQLVQKYEPDILWSDVEDDASETYWKSREFLAWLYNESPVKETIVVNDRWGSGVVCRHGDFFTCGEMHNQKMLQPHKWEKSVSIDKKSWGYRRDAKLCDYLTTEELVEELVVTVSCGGNLMINVGATKDGMIPPIFEERLRDIGSWLRINGEAIYSTRPWTYQRDNVTGGVWYTSREAQHVVYAIVLTWPRTGGVVLGALRLNDRDSVTMLGHGTPLEWRQEQLGVRVSFPENTVTGSNWAWTLKIVNHNILDC